jgi:hypothetical protein
MFNIENKTIQVFIKNVYGKENIYIKDSKVANLISRLTGRITLTEGDIQTLKLMGFELEVIAERTTL